MTICIHSVRRTTCSVVLFSGLAVRLAFLLTVTFGLCTPAFAQTISTVAGTGRAGSSGNGGPATEAQLYTPRDVFVDAAGNLFIGGYNDQLVRRVDTSGTISIVAGGGTEGLGDGGPATEAGLDHPIGVFVDATGNLFIADLDNDRVRKVDPAGTISTVAGTGTEGFSGDGGPATAAQLDLPWDVFVDAAGNLFIADRGNHRVRKVDPAGTISTVAGTGTRGFSGDGGPATEAQLNVPIDVFVDGAGNLFIADANNNRIRKVDPAGTISTVAGTGTAGFSGDGRLATEAQLNDPVGVFVDGAGNLFIGDADNHRVRKVDPAGTISTVAGTGTAGFSGDGGPATEAELVGPGGVFVDAAGNLFIADAGNHRIRRVTPAIATVVEVRDESLPQSFNLSQNYPNPFNAETSIHFDLPLDSRVDIAIYNLAGQKVVTLIDGHRKAGMYSLRWDGRDATGQDLASGTYMYRLRAGDYTESRKLSLVR